MKKLLWFVVGVAAGFVAAHFVSKDPRGREVLSDIDARINEFTERIGDAYREQEANLSGIAADATAAVQGAAADAVDAVKDAAKQAVD